MFDIQLHFIANALIAKERERGQKRSIKLKFPSEKKNQNQILHPFDPFIRLSTIQQKITQKKNESQKLKHSMARLLTN